MNRIILAFACIFMAACSEAVESVDVDSAQPDSAISQSDLASKAGLKLRELTAVESFTPGDIGLDCVHSSHLDSDRILAICSEEGMDSEDDYGLRFYLINKVDETFQTQFRSGGAGDSYTANVAVYGDASHSDRNIIFLEFAAEFPYGVVIYRQVADHVEKIGEIDVIAVDEHDELVSTLGLMDVEGTQDDFRVTFNGPLTRMEPDGNYIDIEAGSLHYSYSHSEWREHSGHK